MDVQISLQHTYLFLDIYQVMELLDYMLVLFKFLRHLCAVFYDACTNLHAHQQCMKSSPFSMSLTVFVHFCLFDNSLSNWGEMIPELLIYVS